MVYFLPDPSLGNVSAVLISYIWAIPEERIRHEVRLAQYVLLLVSVKGILSGCQSMQKLELLAIRLHALQRQVLGLERLAASH